MNLWFRVYEALRVATNNTNHPGHSDPIRALEYVDLLCNKVVMLGGLSRGLLADRKAMRRALVGKAFDAGLRGHPDADELILDWAYDPRDHDPDEPRVEADLALEAARKQVAAPAPKRLLSLH